MARNVIWPTGSRRRRWLFLFCICATVGLSVMFIPGAFGLAPQLSGDFQLDKNATKDLTTVHLGDLNGQMLANAGSVGVCELTTAPNNSILLIDGEYMKVTGRTQAAQIPNNCSFTDPALTAVSYATYTVTRAQSAPSGFPAGTAAVKHPGGSDVTWITYPDSKPGNDWDQVATAVANNPNAANPCSALTGSTDSSVACDWVNDPPGVTIFTGGSSDIADVNTWSCTNQSVPDADEILHAYAAKYSNSTQFLYFGADRYAVNGSKDFGFWFFKNPISSSGATISNTCPTGSFSGGVHAVGDVLILGTFTNGGAVSSIRAFKWVTSGGDVSTHLLSEGTFGDCVPGSSSADGCNTINNTTIPSPWSYSGKGAVAPNVIYGGGFMEGGLDLGALGLSGCFSSFMAETRSSPSLTAELKDFTVGKFESCGSTLTTTPKAADGTTNLGPDTNSNNLVETSIGTGSVQVKDSAAFSVNGTPTYTGTLKFYICGPIANPTACAVTINGDGSVTTNGVTAGSQTVTANGTYTSDAITLTKVGRYCWASVFISGTTGVPNATDNTIESSGKTGECFEVLPVTPTLTTAAVLPAGGLTPTIIGGKADLNGSGTITSADSWTAFYGDASIISGQLDCNTWGATVNAGTAGTGGITTADDCTLLGYDGTADGVTIGVVDGNFDTMDGNPIPDGTPLPAVFPQVGDANNPSVVDAKFAWSTIYGKVDANGDGTINGDDCSFPVVGGAEILGSGCGNSSAFNGFVDLNVDGTITSADSCTTKCFLGKNVSLGRVLATTVPFGSAVYDVATLSGTATQPGTNGASNGGNATYPSIKATNGAPAGDHITFTLTGPGTTVSACSTTASVSSGTNPQDKTVSGDGDYATTGVTPSAPGVYHWQAVYVPDTGGNTLGTSHNTACNDAGEDVTVQQIPTQVSTTQKVVPQDRAVITSSAVGDNIPAGGTVTFYLYDSSANCLAHGTTVGTGGLLYSQAFATSSTPAHSETFDSANTVAVNTDTTVYWRVTYATGDTAHTGRQSNCSESTATTFVNDSGPGTLFP